MMTVSCLKRTRLQILSIVLNVIQYNYTSARICMQKEDQREDCYGSDC
jgi:hypothetical protein